MSEQFELQVMPPGEDERPPEHEPEAIIEEAVTAPGSDPIIRRVCLTSGGGDSTVLAHRLRDEYDELLHIDTGTALPGVREFVIEFARTMNKPLRIVEAKDAFRRMVLGEDRWWAIYEEHRFGEWELPDDFRDRTRLLPTRAERMAMGYHIAPIGFPGAAGHARSYQKLKERPLAQGLREIKAEFGNGGRAQRVLMLTGVRKDESARRKMTGTARGGWERKGNQLWVNPILYWSNVEMRAYRLAHGLPISDVTAMTHRSGECNCLAFPAKGEREFVISVYPEWYRELIQPIEDEAKRRRLRYCQWGWGADAEWILEDIKQAGPMCQDCQLAFDVKEAA